jgi:hypothetical protein
LMGCRYSEEVKRLRGELEEAQGGTKRAQEDARRAREDERSRLALELADLRAQNASLKFDNERMTAEVRVRRGGGGGVGWLCTGTCGRAGCQRCCVWIAAKEWCPPPPGCATGG